MGSPARSGDAAIAFFLQDLDGGGAERAIVGLAGELARSGRAVDLVVGDADSDYRSEVSGLVRLDDFGTRSLPRVFWRLTAYLRRRNPAVVMSAMDTSNILLIGAAKLAGYRGRTVISQRAVVNASLDELAPPRRALTKLLQRICFPRADTLISNSYAAADDVRAMFRMAASKIVTIHNALDVDRIRRLAGEPLGDHAFLDDRLPLVVSVGSLTKRKDNATLVRAFAAVIAQRPAHLVLVGKGPEAEPLASLIASLGLGDSVHLVGFDANPYKWLAAAAVFVSASTGEGFPNTIAEALALGRPVVATDCPGDTAVLLQHGKWGRLVPTAEPRSMAAAILAALDDPHPPDGRIRAADFSPAATAFAYLNALLPPPNRAAAPSREPA